jgi:acylphosphatase
LSLIPTKQVVFSGDVQGVGFRFTTNRLAKRYGLTGWVRNLEDGKVELVMQGELDTMRMLLTELHNAPGRILIKGSHERRLHLPLMKDFSVR